MIKNLFLASSLALAASASFATMAAADGHAKCDISKGSVRIIGNEFPAIQTIGKGAMECAGGDVTVTANLTKEHKDIQVAGLSGNPAEYTTAIVANSSIVALMNDDLLRPLDEYVAKWGKNLKKNQLITVGGKIMAIAFMANAQHLVVRKDLLDKAGIAVPTSYEEMVSAAKMLKEKGIVANPVGGAYSAGWGVAQEFNNMFIGHGGEFFKPGTAEPSVNTDKGVATLKMMKQLTELMNPDSITHNNNETNAEWKAGNVALMNMWGSRAGALKSAEGSSQEVVDGTDFAAAMTVANGTTPATTLWWDGFTIAKNISDEDAEATFKAMMNAIDPKIMQDDEIVGQAVWLIEGYKPSELSKGVLATANAGAKPYPMVPFQGLLHTALGAELPDYLTGKESAEKTLADVEAAYIAAAKEKGFLK